MKVAISIGVAVVLPFGFLVLAGIIVNHMLAKRRQMPPVNLHTSSASTHGNCTGVNCTGQLPALPLCQVELNRAAV
jgi:hypothetical protein